MKSFVENGISNWKPSGSERMSYGYVKDNLYSDEMYSSQWCGQYVCFGKLKGNPPPKKACLINCNDSLLRYCTKGESSDIYRRLLPTGKAELVQRVFGNNPHYKFLADFILRKGEYVGENVDGKSYYYWSLNEELKLPWWKFQLCLFVMRGIATMSKLHVGKISRIEGLDAKQLMVLAIAYYAGMQAPIKEGDHYRIPICTHYDAWIFGRFVNNISLLDAIIRGEITRVWRRNGWDGRLEYPSNYLQESFSSCGRFGIGRLLDLIATTHPSTIGREDERIPTNLNVFHINPDYFGDVKINDMYTLEVRN